MPRDEAQARNILQVSGGRDDVMDDVSKQKFAHSQGMELGCASSISGDRISGVDPNQLAISNPGAT